MELAGIEHRGAYLAVRDLEEGDIEAFVRYWHGGGGADLEFLGIDPAKLGTPADTWQRFRSYIRRRDPAPEAVGFTFTRNATPIGYTNINIFGRPDGYVHVHLTDPQARAQGSLTALFAAMLPAIATEILPRLPISGLVLEARTRNVGINRVLRSIGLIPDKTMHLDDPDGVAGPGEFNVYYLNATSIAALY
jgi:RimJ/RimL family protein N-acetyltransferase